MTSFDSLKVALFSKQVREHQLNHALTSVGRLQVRSNPRFGKVRTTSLQQAARPQIDRHGDYATIIAKCRTLLVQ